MWKDGTRGGVRRSGYVRKEGKSGKVRGRELVFTLQSCSPVVSDVCSRVERRALVEFQPICLPF